MNTATNPRIRDVIHYALWCMAVVPFALFVLAQGSLARWMRGR